MALLWGLPMTAYLVYARGSLSVGVAIAIGVGGALLFGLAWAVWMRTSLLKMVRRLHAGDPALVPSPPVGEYDTRFTASLMNGRLAIGGHAYVGKRSLCFVPHTKNLKAHQHPTEFRFDAAPLVSVIERQPNPFQRLFRPGPDRLLRVGDDQRHLTMLVVNPDDAARALRAHLV
jgi:hypothetical protein